MSIGNSYQLLNTAGEPLFSYPGHFNHIMNASREGRIKPIYCQKKISLSTQSTWAHSTVPSKELCDRLIAKTEDGLIQLALSQIKEGIYKDHIQDDKGQTPLHLAAKEDLVEIVEFLLRNGAKVDPRDKVSYRTPLYMAAQYGSVNSMQCLLNYGADIHAYDGEGCNLFNMVAQSPSMEAIQCLLNNITIGDITCSEHFHTPNTNLLAMDLSPDGNVMRRVRLTPSLDFNISIQQALKNAADIFREDGSNGSVLHVLAQYSSAKVIKCYLNSNTIGEINFLDGSERTPLHYAARHGSETDIQYLIDKGRIVDIDINARDRNGQTPLHLAAERGCPEAIACLLDNGAGKGINVRDKRGNTPFNLAMTDIFSSTRCLPVLLFSYIISDISTDDISKRNLSKWTDLDINVLLATTVRLNILKLQKALSNQCRGYAFPWCIAQ